MFKLIIPYTHYIMNIITMEYRQTLIHRRIIFISVSFTCPVERSCGYLHDNSHFEELHWNPLAALPQLATLYGDAANDSNRESVKYLTMFSDELIMKIRMKFISNISMIRRTMFFILVRSVVPIVASRWR